MALYSWRNTTRSSLGCLLGLKIFSLDSSGLSLIHIYKKTLKRLGTLKDYAENWGNHYALPKPKKMCIRDRPKAEPSFLLSQLPDKLREQGLELSTDPEAYLNSYLGYKMEPNKDPEADWRLDRLLYTSAGCTGHPQK